MISNATKNPGNWFSSVFECKMAFSNRCARLHHSSFEYNHKRHRTTATILHCASLITDNVTTNNACKTMRDNQNGLGGKKGRILFMIMTCYGLVNVMWGVYFTAGTVSIFSTAQDDYNEELLADLQSSKNQNANDAAKSTNVQLEDQAVDVPMGKNRVESSISITNRNTDSIDLPLAAGDASFPATILENKNETRFERMTQNSASFKRYDGVVIVTKVLWDKDAPIVAQMLCYMAHAYNDKRNYDIVIFTTIPWSEEMTELVQRAAGKSKVTIALEGPPLEEQLAEMSKEEVTFLRNRCFMQNKTNETLTWQHYCGEEGSRDVVSLGYCWQAEFRAYHIWKHEALKNYKYMVWVDSDCRMAKEWDQDPMEMMVKNDLTLLYSGYPYGKFQDPAMKEKMKKVYNMTLCYTKQRDGELYGRMCEDGDNLPYIIRQVAGSHHITNLDRYRKDVHQQFLKSFVGNHRFSRLYDDQVAVTIVAVMDQRLITETGKVWHERSKNLTLKLAHHRMYDAQPRERAPANKDKFFHAIKKTFPGLEERCAAYFNPN